MKHASFQPHVCNRSHVGSVDLGSRRFPESSEKQALRNWSVFVPRVILSAAKDLRCSWPRSATTEILRSPRLPLDDTIAGRKPTQERDAHFWMPRVDSSCARVSDPALDPTEVLPEQGFTSMHGDLRSGCQRGQETRAERGYRRLCEGTSAAARKEVDRKIIDGVPSSRRFPGPVDVTIRLRPLRV